MTEIERLTELGTRYLVASARLVGYEGSEKDIPKICGNPSGFATTIVEVAKVIAIADRPGTATVQPARGAIRQPEI